MTPFAAALFRSAGAAAVATTWNPADKAASITLSSGDRVASSTVNATYAAVRGAAAKSSGKWYFEVAVTAVGSMPGEESIGLANATAALNAYLGINANSVGYFAGSGAVFYNGGVSTTLSSYTTGNVIGVAWDAGTGRVWFSKNGTFSGDPAAGTGQAATITGTLFPAVTFYQNLASRTLSATATYPIPSGFSLWT